MKNRNDINIEDLLTDDNFIKWVKHPDEDRNLYWKAWLEVHPERKADVLLAKEMLIRSEFRQKAPSREAYAEVLHRLMKTEVNHTQKSQRKINPRERYWDFRVKVAASLAFLALAVALMLWRPYEPPLPTQQAAIPAWVSKQNPAGIKSQIQLPDGTMVWLNAESTLKYPAAFDSASRQVVLIGEAFFDVAKDEQRPFTVQSGHLITRAVGTSFNISSYQEENIAVSLVTGKVIVSENQGDVQDEIPLDPGEQVIYTDHESGFTKTNFDYDFSLGWKDGLLVLKEADVIHIKRKLERWYGVQIEIRGVPKKSWKINGTFKNQSLERVLERLAFSKEFTFQISDKNVIMNFNHLKTS